MESVRIDLNQLLNKLKDLSEEYETDIEESDVFLIDLKDLNTFTERMIQTVSDFIKKDVMSEIESLNGEDLLDDEEGSFDLSDFYDDEDMDP